LRFVLATARKDLLRLARDWPALAIWVGIPLMIGGLLFLVFGGEDAGPHGELLVVDRDGTIAARLLTGAFQQGALAELIEVEGVELEEGSRRIEDGDASGLLVIPEGFGQAALEGEPATVELVTNPSQTIIPGILEETLDVTLEGTEVLRRLFDDPIDQIVATMDVNTGPSDSMVAAISTAFNRTGEEAQGWLLPPAIEIETVASETEDSFDFARAFFPGMLILAILFMAAGLSTDVWTERRQGTLRRAVAAPTGAASIVAGKWIAGTAALGLVAAIGLGVGGGLFGIETQNPILAFLWIMLVGATLLALFTLVQLFSPSETTGNVLANAFTLPLAMLGGSFFPFETMPSWMVRVGQLTPNGWALIRLREIIGGAADTGLVLASMAGACFLIAALGFVATRRLRGFAV
jgi:ABC-type multidrug transport system permease subunit